MPFICRYHYVGQLFLPCFLFSTFCVVALIVLTAIKHGMAAVIAGLASAGAGMVCHFRVCAYNSMEEAVLLWILLVLAVILDVLAALWWNSNKPVFQIVHSLGAFSFTPSIYPAEELKQFAEQVRLMQEGEADGE